MIKVSNSEIDVHAQCRRRWWLTYYRGLTPRAEKATGALALGTRIHTALEGYYTAQLDGEHDVDLLAIHSGLIEADRVQMLMAGYDIGQLDNEADLGQIMLSGYLDWVAQEGIDAGMELVGVEDRLEHEIIEGEAVFTGKVDLRFRNRRDGTQRIVDLKTAAQIGPLLEVAATSPQLMSYCSLNLAATPGDESLTSGTYRILKKVKRTAKAQPPFYVEHEVRYSREQLRNHWRHTRNKVRRIVEDRNRLDAGEDHHDVVPPHVTKDCTWICDFKNICPMFDDGSAAEAALDADFTTHDPRGYLESDPVLDRL